MPFRASRPRFPAGHRAQCIALASTAVLLSACAGLTRGYVGHESPVSPHAHSLIELGSVDSILTPLSVARGASSYTLVRNAGPWRAAVLELDLRCTALEASKGAVTAVGRRTTSGLLAAQPVTTRAIGAVNADFFLFAPPGVPTNAHVEHGQLMAGPDTKPVVFVDETGDAHIDTLRAVGSIGSVALTAWNRPSPRTSGIVDARWGVPIDTATRRNAWRLEPLSSVHSKGPTVRGRYIVQRAATKDTLVYGDTLLLHVTTTVNASWQIGDTLTLEMTIRPSRTAKNGQPVQVRDAVAGRPILVRDSVLTTDVNTEGNAGFQGPNPRTAIGFSRDGKRAWLVVVDGRQPGYSMGMSLTQTGELLRMLGATEGINLDGGGSSALVVRDPESGAGVLRNRPSDPSERPVGNALIASARCGW
ncbi:MAG: phosphodiester glycosidase family protein [Gemmatimonadaceae bacterium]|nr:phosphodiester glycosidase family protein [Gemmatimonadaceae bacterium]